MRPGFVAFAATLAASPATADWVFSDVTAAAGIAARHGYVAARPEQHLEVAGGVAAAESFGYCAKSTARAAAVARHLATLGLEGRVVVGPVGAGAPGVAIVLGGRVS